MNIHIFSDLHAGSAPLKPIRIGNDVDVVVVAGDVAEGAENSSVSWLVLNLRRALGKESAIPTCAMPETTGPL
jgi:3',5'-cyclic AMP phosphodiesterase CpdA